MTRHYDVFLPVRVRVTVNVHSEPVAVDWPVVDWGGSPWPPVANIEDSEHGWVGHDDDETSFLWAIEQAAELAIEAAR